MDILRQRVLLTERYLKALELSLSVQWADAYKEVIDSEDWIPKLALVHPEHYRDLSFNTGDCPVRGTRRFSKETAMFAKGCGCELLWDYRCPIEPDGITVSADHLFPYSFGGPTLANNKIYLCPRHNGVKGSDIHYFPWEKGEPLWLNETLTLVARLKSFQ